MRKTKKELLQHYAGRDPQPFIQFDCFVCEDGTDSFIKPDEDGDSLFHSGTYELMTGAYGLRVLVRPDMTKRQTVRGLSKIISLLLQENYDALSEGIKILRGENEEV